MYTNPVKQELVERLSSAWGKLDAAETTEEIAQAEAVRDDVYRAIRSSGLDVAEMIDLGLVQYRQVNEG